MIGSFHAHLSFILAALMAASGAIAAQDPPRRESQAALRNVVRALTVEAQQAMSEGRLEHRQPNAADRFDERIGESELQRAVIERQHREPFIDAYIRWQLTSYDFDLPAMTPQVFTRFLDQAPPMIENPRGSERALSLFTRASDAGSLSPGDLAQLREANRELDRQTQIAEAMNVPATEFREWVAGQLGDSGPHRLLWLLENCAATINAAWAPANVKRNITQTFTASAADPSISDADRHAIAQQVQNLAGLSRRFVNQVTFMADGSVRVTFSNAQITNRDVENWIERLGANP